MVMLVIRSSFIDLNIAWDGKLTNQSLVSLCCCCSCVCLLADSSQLKMAVTDSSGFLFIFRDLEILSQSYL